MGDAGMIAGDGGGDAEDLAHGAGRRGRWAGVEAGFVEDVGFDSVGKGVGAAVALDGDGIDAPDAVVQIAGIVLRHNECADAGSGGVGGGVVAVVVGVERRRVVDAGIRGDDAGDGRDVGIALRGGGLHVGGGVGDGLIEDRTGRIAAGPWARRCSSD